MNSLQEMAFIFDYSAKKRNLFKEQLANDAVARTNIEGRQKLKTLCETRWASSSETLYTFNAAFSTRHATLGELSSDHSDSKAGTFQAAIERFDFIVTLAEHALSGIVPLASVCRRYRRISQQKNLALSSGNSMVKDMTTRCGMHYMSLQ